MNDKLSFSIDFLRAAFYNLPIPIIMINRNERIVFINKSYEDLLQIEENDAIGKHIFEFIPNSRLPYCMNKGIEDINGTHTFQNGQTAIGTRIPIYHQSEVIGCIGFILFQNNHQLQRLAIKYKELESQLSIYKNVLKNHNYPKYSFENIKGVSKSINECKNIALLYSSINLPIMVLGENGVGKELFVHAIHASSNRKYAPFVRVNCSSIPKDLFESEFFGYEKGSFSGARPEGKKGFFELASSGTLFLDEVTDLPHEMQGKLLRVLQENEFMRVGGNQIINCNVRIISATNKDIKQMVEKGEFREDLYYRLNNLVLAVPPLRNRKEDIPLLINSIIEEFCSNHDLARKAITTEALALLQSYNWPGNIRELKNVITRALLLSTYANITTEDLTELQSHQNKAELKSIKNNTEIGYIFNIVKECNNNISEAAKILGVHRSTLYRKIQKYNKTT